MPLLISCTPVSNAAEDNAQTDIVFGKGEQYELCQDYAAELIKHDVSSANFCGVAIPLDNPNYRLPEWTDLNPSENLELVKTFYYWHNMGSSRSHELYREQMNDKSKIIPALLDLYWPKAEAQVLALVASGDIQLQTSRFDIDFDGVIETVYRMTPLIILGGALEPWVREEHQVRARSGCTDFGLPDGESGYLYYVSPDELPQQDYGALLDYTRLSMRGFFYWKDRVYWDWGQGAIFEGDSTSDIGITNICSMLIKTRNIGND